MKKSGEFQYKQKSTLDQYYAEISGTSLFAPNEESSAFRRIEEAEQKYIFILLRDRDFWRNALYKLENTLREADEWSEEIEILSKEVGSSSPSKKSVTSFVRKVRFLDSGRTWMRTMYEMSQDPKRIADRSEWANEVGRSFRSIQRAKNVCINANLRLVINVARRHFRSGISQNMTDLIQEGNIGLMRAVDKFDIDRGYRFATYASWWIKQNIRRALDDKEPIVRVPVHVCEDAKKINRLEGFFMAQHGEAPNVEQLSKLAKMSVPKVENAITHKYKASMSLDAFMGDDDDTWLDHLEDPSVESPVENLVSEEIRWDINEMLTLLTPQECAIVRWRYGLDGGNEMTLQEIGTIYSISRERVRQIEVQAINKMRVRSNKLRHSSV